MEQSVLIIHQFGDHPAHIILVVCNSKIRLLKEEWIPVSEAVDLALIE